MGFEHDDSKWPIVKLRWVGTVTDQEVTEGLVRVDGYLNRRERFGFLIDGRGGGGLSPEQRNRVIGHMKLRAGLTAEFLVQAVIFDNLIQRTLYYGIHLLFPMAFPSKVFADPLAAEAWLIGMVGASSAAREVSVRPEAREPKKS